MATACDYSRILDPKLERKIMSAKASSFEEYGSRAMVASLSTLKPGNV